MSREEGGKVLAFVSVQVVTRASEVIRPCNVVLCFHPTRSLFELHVLGIPLLLLSKPMSSGKVIMPTGTFCSLFPHAPFELEDILEQRKFDLRVHDW